MFSVIIPVYNGEKFIENAIASVKAQTVSEWELIVVNDGSKDGTKDVLSSYEGDENIRIVHQENGGVSRARNHGVSLANGEYITFLDADDIWEKNHLAVMQDLIARYPDAGLYGTFTRAELVNGGEISSCSFFEKRSETDVYLNDFLAAYHRDKSAKMFTVITTCVSKEAFYKAGGFPEGCAIGEDLELSLRIAAYYPVVLSKIITASYKKENSTATRTRSFDPDWGFFEGVHAIYEDDEVPLYRKENLEKVMQWFTMRRCRHYLIEGNKKRARQVYRNSPKTALSKKDRLINAVLMLLPTAVTGKLFAVRWRGKA